MVNTDTTAGFSVGTERKDYQFIEFITSLPQFLEGSETVYCSVSLSLQPLFVREYFRGAIP